MFLTKNELDPIIHQCAIDLAAKQNSGTIHAYSFYNLFDEQVYDYALVTYYDPVFFGQANSHTDEFKQYQEDLTRAMIKEVYGKLKTIPCALSVELIECDLTLNDIQKTKSHYVLRINIHEVE